jgi:tetratricopeptide (TPR) repeat protein
VCVQLADAICVHRDLPKAADVSNSVLASPGTHVGGAAPSGRNSSSGAAAASRGDTPGRRWLDAARAGHLGLLQRLLPSFPELWAHRGPGLGHTALHWAAARDDSAMLKWLLVQPGADVGACNNVGATALHAAAGNDAVASLQVLTAAGADLLARDEGEETPHDVATRLKRVAALAFLDDAAREAAGACQSAHVVQCPAPTPASPPRPAGERPLPQASEADAGVDLVRISGSASELQEPPDVGDIDRQLGRRWLDAARSGDVSCLSDLLNSEPRLLYYWGAGTNYGFSGHSALHWAAAKGHADALRALLRAGANPDVPNHGGGRPLHAAAANGQTQCARMLLLHGGACASLHNGLEETPRELALISGHTDTAQAIEEAARAAQLRDVLPVDASEFRGAAVRAAQAALAAAGQDVRAFTERDDLFAAAKQLAASLPPLAVLRRSELVPVPSAKPAACVPPTGAADPSVSTSFDSDEAGTGSAAEIKLASAAKERGNTAFAALEYSRAAAAYTVALRFDRGNAVLLSNRSAALAAMCKYEAALEDAERAVRAAPKWGKAHARRGTALVGLGQAGEAVKAYAAGLAVEPDAAYLREGLAEARAAICSAQARYSAMWGERPSETHTSDA